MKVLVTGSGGFIARHLIKRLLEDGHMVIGIDDYSNSQPDPEWESNFQFNECDITSLNPKNTLFSDVECIFHLAAKARVQPSFIDPKKYYDTNVIGTLNLLEACVHWGIGKFIFSSSSSVYGNIHLPDDGHREDSALDPQSPYAISKVHGEDLCMWYSNMYSIDCTILRYFNVYGDNQPSNGQYPQMLPYFMHLYKENEPFIVYGTGDQRRDFTHVGDVVNANIEALICRNYKIGGKVYNIGSGVNHSVKEICEMIDAKHPIKYLSRRQEPFQTLANNNLAASELGWKPITTVDRWIRTINQEI